MLINFKDLFLTIYNFLSFLRKNKIISLPIAGMSLIIITTIYYFGYYYYTNNNADYNDVIRKNIIKEKIDFYLKQCGDKTAISIGVISTEKLPINDYWDGVFEYARACDFNENPKDCILNLKEIKEMYNYQYQIDTNSYQFLVKIDRYIPAYISLVDENGNQDISKLMSYPAISKMIIATDWHQKGILNSIWVASIVNSSKKLVYILTMTSAKPISQLKCINQVEILNNLKNLIKT